MKQILNYCLFIALLVVCSCEKDDAGLPVPPPYVPPGPSVPDTTQAPPVEDEDTFNIEITRYELCSSGNDVSEDKGEVLVAFDRSVGDCELSLRNGLYTNLTLKSLSEDGMTAIFASPFYFTLGMSYSFLLDVCDANHKSHRFNFTINNYKACYEYEGVYQRAISDYDSQTIWFTTRFPNRLYRVEMAHPENPTYLDLDQIPGAITINPYNGKLYLGINAYDYDALQSYRWYMYILNATTLEMEDSIQVSFQSSYYSDDPKAIDNYPLAVAFTNDGFGALVMKHYHDSGGELYFIDSARGNKLIISDYGHTEATYIHDCLEGAVTSYDGTFVICTPMNNLMNLFFVSRNQRTPKEFGVNSSYNNPGEYWSGGNVICRAFHRSEPKFFSNSVQSQCVINYKNHKYSKVVLTEGRFTRGCTFDYGAEDCVVKTEGYSKYLLYMDMKTGEVTSAIPFAYNSSDLDMSLFHNPVRDELIALSRTMYSGATIYTYDMKSIRDSQVHGVEQ